MIRLHKNSGRSHGKLKILNSGGGHKLIYKYINFKPLTMNYEVLDLSFNFRNQSQVALINYNFNLFTPLLLNYIIPFTGIFKGQTFYLNNSQDFPGKFIKLKNLALRTKIHLLELFPNSSSKLIKSHDCYGRIINQYNNKTLILLPSKKLKYVSNLCYARIGLLYKQLNLNFYKAGQVRALNFRPVVRGLAKNTCDHPMGGGRGKSKSNKIPRTPYGKIIKK